MVEVGERWGRGHILYIFLQPLPHFGGVVEVYPSTFNWKRHGSGGGEVW